jgi:hypothetical protein
MLLVFIFLASTQRVFQRVVKVLRTEYPSEFLEILLQGMKKDKDSSLSI